MPKLTIANVWLPVGVHSCVFKGTEVVSYPDAGLKWRFVVNQGVYVGLECWHITGFEPTPKNECGMFLGFLSDRKPSEGLEVDTDVFINLPYYVIITESQDESTRVESFSRTADE